MQIHEVTFRETTPINGYGPGFFRVGGEVFQGAVIVQPEQARAWEGYADDAPLLALAGIADVLFIGTGAETAHIPADLRTRLEEAGLGVEVMHSAAACRTYNVLLSVGRRVAAALLPV